MTEDSADIARELAQLKDEVAQLRQLVEQLYYRSGQPVPAGAPGSVGGIPADVEDALRAGSTILAIKLWRAHTGLSLGDAKDQVEAMRARLI